MLIGLFDKCALTVWTTEWRAHYEKLADNMVEHGFNTLVMQSYQLPEHALEVISILHAHDLSAILTVGNPQNTNWDYAGPGKPFHPVYTHPAVVALRYGDEPGTETALTALAAGYAALRYHYPNLPVITPMVGENINGTEEDFAHEAWTALNASPLFARCYPVRKDKSMDQSFKPMRDFAAAMSVHSTARNVPWWAIVQAFGEGLEHDTANYWRFPTVAELRAQIYSCLANGASGIFVFGSVPFGSNTHCIYDADLNPTNGKDGAPLLDAIRELSLQA